jgi:hypothetical protein
VVERVALVVAVLAFALALFLLPKANGFGATELPSQWRQSRLVASCDPDGRTFVAKGAIGSGVIHDGHIYTNSNDNKRGLQCLDANGKCTLRAAVEQANALPSCGLIPIDFAIGSATITLTDAAGELSVKHDVNIMGPTAVSGNSIVIDGNHASRIFSIDPGKTVSISNLNITAGNGSGGDGGSYMHAPEP